MAGIAVVDRVTLRDWLLAGVGLAFTLAGLLILRRDFNTGIVTLALFGLCFAYAVSVIVRKRRAARLAAVCAGVVGGVPIRPSRARFASYGLGMLALGGTLAAFATGMDPTLPAIGWLLLVLGAGLLAGVALGWAPVGHLQFDPDGITLDDWGGQAFVPWEAVTGLGRSEVHGNPAVLLAVDDSALVLTPARYRTRLDRQRHWWRARAGADFVIFSGNCGIDAPVLLAALERYLDDPLARDELRHRPALPAAAG